MSVYIRRLTGRYFEKYHLTDKLLYYDLVAGRDILHKLGIIFNFENDTITWQEVSISMKPPYCTAKKILCNQRKSSSPKYN